MATESSGEKDVTYEARVVVDDGTQRAEVVEAFATVQAARAWVLDHATITKVVRKAVW